MVCCVCGGFHCRLRSTFGWPSYFRSVKRMHGHRSCCCIARNVVDQQGFWPAALWMREGLYCRAFVHNVHITSTLCSHNVGVIPRVEIVRIRAYAWSIHTFVPNLMQFLLRKMYILIIRRVPAICCLIDSDMNSNMNPDAPDSGSLECFNVRPPIQILLLPRHCQYHPARSRLCKFDQQVADAV